MLTHANGRWSTECEKCRAPIEVVGAPDKRPSKSGSELTKAAEFLLSLGWSPSYRKNAAWRIDFVCPACTEKRRCAASTTGLTSARFDMFPAKKGA